MYDDTKSLPSLTFKNKYPNEHRNHWTIDFITLELEDTNTYAYTYLLHIANSY